MNRINHNFLTDKVKKTVMLRKRFFVLLSSNTRVKSRYYCKISFKREDKKCLFRYFYWILLFFWLVVKISFTFLSPLKRMSFYVRLCSVPFTLYLFKTMVSYVWHQDLIEKSRDLELKNSRFFLLYKNMVWFMAMVTMRSHFGPIEIQ